MAPNESLLDTALRLIKQREFAAARDKLLTLQPLSLDNPMVFLYLGVCCFETGELRSAVEYLQKGVTLAPQDPQLLFNLGCALQESQQYSEALRMFGRVLRLVPDHLMSLLRSGTILNQIGSVSVAEKIGSQILQKDDRNWDGYNLVATALKDQGKTGEALRFYRYASRTNPDLCSADSNYLLTLCYDDTVLPEIVFQEHTAWHAKAVKWQTQKVMVAPVEAIESCDRPLRVGYVSSDLRVHSVTYFIEPVILNHDPARVTTHCYANVANPDTTTGRIAAATQWRSIYAKSDEEARAMIRRDNIDILVDLGGHSGDNRLTLFLEKVAPVQVTYLGYPNTTGMKTIDYRLTDSLSDPPGNDRYYSEKLWRLPGGFLCYKPGELLPPPVDPLTIKDRPISFGSANSLCKLSMTAIELWAEVLHENPGSRLHIKSKPFNDPEVVSLIKRHFLHYGIIAQRLQFQGHISSAQDHLAWYNEIDIALDTYPYNGTATTCEALSMGVPVLTLAGTSHASRVGYSILHHCNLLQWVAFSPEEFIAKARYWAAPAQTGMLRELKRNLRESFPRSNVCDGPGFTKRLEEAYRAMATMERSSSQTG